MAENPNRCHIYQVIKVNIATLRSSWYNALRAQQNFHDIFVKNVEYEFHHEKIPNYVKLRNIPQNIWPVPFKHQSHDKQRKTE